ncbi:MAG: response regulator transcription factor [Ignavibacteriales bacterium]|nr:MAG: response regulator transcription factor [Ignavibacteriales bacterium]
MKKVTILLADDHPIVRHGMRAVLTSLEGMEVIAEAKNGEEALGYIAELRPDVAIVDLSMPGMGGLDILRQLKETDHPVKVIINTGFKDESLLKSALKLGAKGFILKENALTEIGFCLEKVLGGGRYISDELTELMISANEQEAPDFLAGLSMLTLSERKILKYVAMGKSTKEIAAELVLSYRTIENHRNNICKKMGLTGGNALLKFALDNKDKL